MRQKFDGFEWEVIGMVSDVQTLRAKVYGGWLVKSITQITRNKVMSESMVFVPDRDHEWLIIEPVQATVSNEPVIPY